MKKTLLSLVVLLCATVTFAQSNLLATLSHDGTISNFYGVTALQEAVEAADHGDVITLSRGTFNSAPINKAITLRGTGMVEINDETGYFAPTVITGATTVDVPTSTPYRLEIEGVKFNDDFKYQNVLKNAVFKKCNFYSVSYVNATAGDNPKFDYLNNVVLLGCRVRREFDVIGTVSCVNSIIESPYIWDLAYRVLNYNTIQFANCVITGAYPRYLPLCRFQNSYIAIAGNYATSPSQNVIKMESYSLASNCVINNCVSNSTSAFAYCIDSSNRYCSATDFFEVSPIRGSGDSQIDDSKKCTLTETAAATYLGDDGTEVGIYGGNLPYEEKVAIPRITKYQVAGKSTKEGKLSVDVTVEAQ